jgi:peptidoglycan hydrolase-like protein with peptidoglycan-binding domain
MKKLVLSAAVLATVTGGMTAAANLIEPTTASACAYHASTSTAFAASLPQVRPGARGTHVLALQLTLRLEGYGYLHGTGTYAGQTLRAVKDFQRKHGIKASGIVGQKTWQALVGKKPLSSTGGKLMAHTKVFTLQPGERNENKVASLLNMLQRIYPYRAPADGQYRVYSPAIQQMVLDFQLLAGIKASGIVGTKTVTAMDEVVSVSGQWGC